MNWRINHKYLKITALFFFVLVALFTAGYLFLLPTKKEKISITPTPSVSKSSKDITKDNPSSYNLLLLGYGGSGHDGSSLSDVLIVINLDQESRKVTLISIPRDVWVEMPIRSDKSEYHKINEAYAIGSSDSRYPLKQPQYKGEFGGGELAKKAVSEVTGLAMDSYIAIDFNGFKTLIDELGEIEVDVPVAFDDYFYPIKGLENEPCGKTGEEIAQLTRDLSGFELQKQFECRYEHLHFDKGKQLMSGETALKFARSRHSAEHGGDFARSQRQFALLVAIKNKLLSTNVLDNLDKTYNQLSSFVKTDLNLSLVKNNLELIGNPSSYSISYLRLTSDNVLHATKNTKGQFILVPKEGIGIWKPIHQFVDQEISKP